MRINLLGHGLARNDLADLAFELLNRLRDGAEQSDVNTLERVLCQFADGDFLIAKLEFLARGTGRCQQRELAHRKVSFPKRFDHLDADGARRADHRNMWIPVHKRGTQYSDW